MTGYVVLTRPDHGDAWVVVGKFQARDAGHAAVQASEETQKGGTFVAIPARSWKLVSVTRTEVVQTKVEAAS